MMRHRIAPVGNPISHQHHRPTPTLVNADEHCFFLNSGTAALAAAMIISARTSSATKPEVILPAYSCPDLLSAAEYAGLTPILIDFETDQPYMSLAGIDAAISHQTAAIVAVNFLGIPERLIDIRSLIGEHNIVLIEDSAQWFPCTPVSISDSYLGDLVVLSFGKGKPVSLLGGGALLIKDPTLLNIWEPPPPPTMSTVQKLKLISTYQAYNTILSPWAYWFLEALPFIELGITRFKTLETISTLDDFKLGFLAENISSYQARNEQPQKQLQQLFYESPNDTVINLPAICASYNDQRLLRYPILLACEQQRDALLTQLNRHGCGASPLYPTILPFIPGVDKKLRTLSDLSNARDFASRILTLPTHFAVNDKHMNHIQTYLDQSTPPLAPL